MHICTKPCGFLWCLRIHSLKPFCIDIECEKYNVFRMSVLFQYDCSSHASQFEKNTIARVQTRRFSMAIKKCTVRRLRFQEIIRRRRWWGGLIKLGLNSSSPVPVNQRSDQEHAHRYEKLHSTASRFDKCRNFGLPTDWIDFSILGKFCLSSFFNTKLRIFS